MANEDKIVDINQLTQNVLAEFGYEPTVPAKAAEPETKDTTTSEQPQATAAAASPDAQAKPVVPSEQANGDTVKKEEPPKKEEQVVTVTTPPPQQATIAADSINQLKQAVSDAIKESKPEPEKKVVDDGIDPKARRDLKVFEEMSKLPQYRGLDNQYKQFVHKMNAYRSVWEKDNPGAKFDVDDEDHADFLERHAPKYDQDDFDDVRVELKAKEIVEREQSKLKDELEKERINTELPNRVAQESSNAAKQAVGMIDETLVDKLKSREGWEALKAEDPIKFDEVARAVHVTRNVAEELTKLNAGDKTGYKFSESNPSHVRIYETITSIDKSIRANPSAQINDGKRYVSPWEFDRLPKREAAGYWTITPNDIIGEVSRSETAAAKQRISQFQALVDARVKAAMPAGFTPSASQVTQVAGTAAAPKPLQASSKPAPPSTATASDVSQNTGAGGNVGKRIADYFSKEMALD